MNLNIKWPAYLMLFLLVASGTDVAAQSKKKTVTKKSSSKPASSTKKTDTDVLSASVSNSPDTTAKPVITAPPANDPFGADTIRRSIPFPLGDASIERNLNKSRKPLPYEHIREDDAWYRERVWRDIDIREKMNLPFRYRAEDDNGSQRFINILFNSIKSGEVTAFDPIDDRFTTPMSLKQITQTLVGKCDTLMVPDFDKDPNGQIMKPVPVCDDFNPDNILKFRIKEEWVFDKESSRMYTRILGIAPLKENLVNGVSMGESPIFWIYYPDLRPSLALYEVYNGKNFGAKMSWEELFESRYFSSNIVKSTIDNPYDLYIKQYIKDNILKLLESDNIKSKIFNFEQDLWSY
jgi:gliding motility associated protien GldN